MSAWVKTGATIGFWYTSNIIVVISNKYLLTNYGFKYPIFLTGCHMVACATLAYATSFSHLVPRQSITNRTQFWKIALLSCAFCLSVVLGNVSLRYIPVSFNQAIGATTPLFTALISLLLLTQWESTRVYLSLVPIALGLVLASQGEPLFNAIGFTTAVIATCARGFKSVLSGLLLTDPTEKMNSMNLLLYMAPIAATALLPAILVSERDVLLAVRRHASIDPYFLPALTVNAGLSFLVNLSNFMVTKQTSALTLQVLGNAKGVVAASLSILLFRNPVTTRGALGYAIALGGVALYSRARLQSAQSKATAPLPSLSNDEQPSTKHYVDSSVESSPTIKSHPVILRSPTKGMFSLDRKTHALEVFAQAGMPHSPGNSRLVEV